MAATFFFSYARYNQGAYLDKFVGDLTDLLRSRAGRYEDDLVFFDRGIEPGADWPGQIRGALRTCQIFFSLESPAYFQREYCGKEWGIFRKRLEDHAHATRQAVPPLHIRIQWMPLLESQIRSVPQAVHKIQDTRWSIGDLYAIKGFEHLLRLNLEREYQEALTRLVELVVDALEKHHLPPASEIPDLSVIESAFRCPTQPQAAGVASAGVGHVLVGVIAGVQEEVRSFRETQDSYGSEPKDWRPFHPTVTQRIGPIVQGVASDLDLTSTILQMDSALPEKLDEAERTHNLMVVLLDPWALRLDECRKHALAYDAKHCLNNSLLIPWPSDMQTRDHRAKLSDLVRATLAKTSQREPSAYREEIDSLDRLKAELIKAITRATALVIEQGEVTRRAESSNWPITMPLLSGPVGATNGP